MIYTYPSANAEESYIATDYMIMTKHYFGLQEEEKQNVLTSYHWTYDVSRNQHTVCLQICRNAEEFYSAIDANGSGLTSQTEKTETYQGGDARGFPISYNTYDYIVYKTPLFHI